MGKSDVDNELRLEDIFKMHDFGPIFNRFRPSLIMLLCLIIGLSIGHYLGWQMGKQECLKMMIYAGCELPYVMIEDYSKIPVFDLSDLPTLISNKTPIYTLPDR